MCQAWRTDAMMTFIMGILLPACSIVPCMVQAYPFLTRAYRWQLDHYGAMLFRRLVHSHHRRQFPEACGLLGRDGVQCDTAFRLSSVC